MHKTDENVKYLRCNHSSSRSVRQISLAKPTAQLVIELFAYGIQIVCNRYWVRNDVVMASVLTLLSNNYALKKPRK